VLAGVEIQKSMAASGANETDAKPLQLRIGISTGEVTVQANDVFGSAVNLASRVQQIAEPGRVFFTEATFAMLNVQEAPASEVGVVELKGIPQPVKVYQALAGNSAASLQARSFGGATKP
jgi:class 3 adenylate cyclase